MDTGHLWVIQWPVDCDVKARLTSLSGDTGNSIFGIRENALNYEY